MVIDHHVRRLKGKETPSVYSFRIVNTDGTVKWVELNATFIQWKKRPAALIFLNDISDRRQVDEALRQSEEKYRTILENIEDGYYEVDLAGNFTFVNDSMCRILGHSREKMMGMNNRQYTDKEYAKKLFKTFNEVYKTGIPSKEFDWQIIRKGGIKKHIEASVSLRKNSSGQPIGFQGIVRDVTDRKQTEVVLQESEKKYRTIIENIQDGYFEVDLAGNYTFFNEALCEIYGFTKEELMGRNNRQCADEENAKKIFRAFNEIYKTGISGRIFDYEIIRKDGTRRQGELSVSLKKDSAGKAVGFTGTARDVTERMQTEKALRESEEYFKEITENSSDIIIITDKKGDIKYCSLSVERFTGYKPEELIGRNVVRFIHPDDAKRAAR